MGSLEEVQMAKAMIEWMPAGKRPHERPDLRNWVYGSKALGDGKVRTM